MKHMTEEMRQQIAQLWNQNWTSAKIAAEIGVTRNVVVGTIHRLRQRGQILKSADEKRNYKVRPKKILVISKNVVKPSDLGKPVGLMKLTSQSCRFIVEEGSVEETLYCNNQIYRSSYCEEHYKICYVTPRRFIEETLTDNK